MASKKNTTDNAAAGLAPQGANNDGNGEVKTKRTRKVSPEATAARLAARKWASDTQSGLRKAINSVDRRDRMDIKITFRVGGAQEIDLVDLGMTDFGDLFPKPVKIVTAEFGGEVIFSSTMEIEDDSDAADSDDETEEVAGG